MVIPAWHSSRIGERRSPQRSPVRQPGGGILAGRIRGGFRADIDESIRDVYNPVSFVGLRSRAFACHERVTAGALKKTRSRARSKRNRFWRVRYRRRRLLAVLVLACLFFGIGTQAAAFFKAEGTGSVGTVERSETPSFVPATFEELLAQGDSGTIPADETRSPAHDTMKDLAASSSRKRTNETGDGPARKVALEARKE